VADVAALIDQLAPSRLALVGPSMGGTIAALLAGTLPTRVERLALIEGIGPPAMGGPEAGVQRMRQWLGELRTLRRGPRRLPSLDEAIERLRRFHPKVSQPVLERVARQLTRQGEGNALFWAYDPLHRTTSPIPFQAEIFKAFLANITCPTLYVSGGPEGYHPADEAQRLACLRNLVEFEIPGAGHMMHWTVPAALAARLIEFLASPNP
jgi:pimeloyl-ACP methyl ester carboxylesterase